MSSQTSPTSPAPPTQAKPIATAKPPTKNKPRKRVNTAEKRHQHNAIERARRETLNSKFITLARLLPSLADSRRPSKSAIVNGSIAHLTHQREERLLAVRLLRKLCAEHDALVNEVNEWRTHSGYAAKGTVPAWTDQMEQLASVEKETFGTFANYEGGDDDDNDDAPENDQGDQSSDRPRTNISAPIDNGLIARQSPVESMPMNNSNMLHNLPMPPPNFNWSHDFAAGLHGPQPSSAGLAPAPRPFGNFLVEQMDRSSSNSPAASQFGVQVMTPNTTADINPFNGQTPSPRSSQSGSLHIPAEDVKTASSVPQGWAASQALFFQQQQQQQLQRLHDQQNQNMAQRVTDQQYGCSSSFPLAMGFPMAQRMDGMTSNGQFTNQAFTQQLFASMFPSGNIPSSPHEQINQWRKNASNAMQPQAHGASQMLSTGPSVDELRNAVRTGMGLGLGMASMWNEPQQSVVEGF